MDDENFKNRRLMEVIEINLESFNNLTSMLGSKNREDVNLALETIKNIKPSDELLRLFLKKTQYAGRRELIEMINKNIYSYQELTMAEIYTCIKKSNNPNKENLKIIYKSLVEEHFNKLFEDFDFINNKLEIAW